MTRMMWPNIRRGSIYASAAASLLAVFCAFGLAATGGYRSMTHWSVAQVRNAGSRAEVYMLAAVIFLLIGWLFAFRAFALRSAAQRFAASLIAPAITATFFYLALHTF